VVAAGAMVGVAVMVLVVAQWGVSDIDGGFGGARVGREGLARLVTRARRGGIAYGIAPPGRPDVCPV